MAITLSAIGLPSLAVYNNKDVNNSWATCQIANGLNYTPTEQKEQEQAILINRAAINSLLVMHQQ